ncbi:hypothetical protein [Leptospira wolbachii]|uniref:hypothetical protein n=1 Tax=Leptospira wolbachii TaxID=29511 RepID=UPI0005901588|nr:hypothetical protein [Leptospira wolbachii]
MKRKFLLVIVFILLILTSCQKEEDYWKTSPEFKLFVLREILWQQGNCLSPNSILEKGVSYSITLKAGERFWFDFKERRSADSFKFRNYTLNVFKLSNDKIGSRSVSCRSSVKSDTSLYMGEELSSTQLQFKYTENGNQQRGYFLEGISENSTYSIIHSITEELQ